MIHTKDQIDHFLRDAFFAVLTFSSHEGLVSQLTCFGHTMDGNFYLISQNDKEIFNSLFENKDVSVLIYKEEENLDDIRQVNITGTGTLIEGFDSEDARIGYESVGAKSPVIANVPLDPQNHKYYTLIKIEAKTIASTSYAEMKKHIPPTVLKRE